MARERMTPARCTKRETGACLFKDRCVLTPFQNPAEMRLAQDNHMIDALAPDRSDQPFGKAILPRRAWCSGLVPDAHGTQSARDDNAVDSIPISDHIARSHLPGEKPRLSDVQPTPPSGWL